MRSYSRREYLNIHGIGYIRQIKTVCAYILMTVILNSVALSPRANYTD
jgi:hypothetical protein